jgi:hypothetical protein
MAGLLGGGDDLGGGRGHLMWRALTIFTALFTGQALALRLTRCVDDLLRQTCEGTGRRVWEDL